VIRIITGVVSIVFWLHYGYLRLLGAAIRMLPQQALEGAAVQILGRTEQQMKNSMLLEIHGLVQIARGLGTKDRKALSTLGIIGVTALSRHVTKAADKIHLAHLVGVFPVIRPGVIYRSAASLVARSMPASVGASAQEITAFFMDPPPLDLVLEAEEAAASREASVTPPEHGSYT